MFTIESNIPVPSEAYERPDARSKFPFAQMEVGDSFFVAGAISRSTRYSAQYRTGHVYVTAPETRDGVEGTRVWRDEGETPIKFPRKPKA
jgi:hypothetical protein